MEELGPESMSAYSQVFVFPQWFSKNGPQTSSISINWEIVRNTNSWALPRLTESEILVWGLGISAFRCSPGDLDTD